MLTKEGSGQANKATSVATSRTRKVIFRGTLVISSILVALMVAEGIVRFFLPQAVPVPWRGELDGVMAPRPNVRGRLAVPNTFDTIISYNSQRFRGLREYSQTPATGVKRIATLGDSFTYGWGANDDETYPAQLERHLIKRLSSRTTHGKVEVINAGVIGSGTGEEALYYSVWVARFHPDLVILNVYANDVDDDLGQKTFVMNEIGNATPRPQRELVSAGAGLRRFRGLVNALPLYSYLAQHSQLFSLFRYGATVVMREIRNKRASASEDQAYSQASADLLTTIYSRQGIPIMAAEIRWLNGRVRESGSRLVVTFLPPQWWTYKNYQAEWEWKSDRIARALAELCPSEGIPFIDVTPLVRARESSLGKSLYYQGLDGHPNPMGYEVFGEVIGDYLLSQGLVAADARAVR